MEEPTKKKGMSKGCLIGLIVAGVLLVMIIIAAIVLYVYREDVARFGASTVVSSVEKIVAEQPIEGVDSTGFASVCSAFSEKLKNDPLDAEKYQVFFSRIQTIPTDGKVDSLEAVLFLDAVFEYYPELEDLYPVDEVPETLMEVDSVDTESEQ